MKIDIARQPLVPAFVTLFALAVTAMWGGAGNGVSCRRAGDNAPAGRSAGPVSGRLSGVGASGRGIHDPLHGHVHGADRHPLQPLWSQHMSADSALRRRRLRHRFGRKLPDGIRRLDAAGARRQELLPLLLATATVSMPFSAPPSIWDCCRWSMPLQRRWG